MYANQGNTIEDHRPCAIDYEEKAKEVKVTIDNNKIWLASTKLVLDNLNTYEYKDEARVLYGMYGAFTLALPTLEAEYDRLLKKIEDKG